MTNFAHARILVADDDSDLLDAVSEVFVRQGADVVRAASGSELIERLATQGPFSLVVTDISMPWMTGLQAMHSARTVGFGNAVIVMTALRDERITAQVRALGVNAALLRKPFELSELQSLATKLLSGRSVQDASESRS
jgi:CheY-like chemotaxis protein